MVNTDGAWRRSSRCESGHCVEIKEGDGVIVIRDSRNPDGPVLEFSEDAWSVFVEGAKNGEFDI